jgi:hypothetical protein
MTLDTQNVREAAEGGNTARNVWYSSSQLVAIRPARQTSFDIARTEIDADDTTTNTVVPPALNCGPVVHRPNHARED